MLVTDNVICLVLSSLYHDTSERHTVTQASPKCMEWMKTGTSWHFSACRQLFSSASLGYKMPKSGTGALSALYSDVTSTGSHCYILVCCDDR